MIRFSDENIEPQLRDIWKICFEDTDEFIDLIFTQKYKPENTLVYTEGNQPVAVLYMFPYTFTFYGKEIPFYYFAGLSTLPQYRKKGYMEKLIIEAFGVMQKRNIPLSILIPAEDWLYGFYEKYGYGKIFEAGNRSLLFKQILDKYPNDLTAAYREFDMVFNKHDFTIQKTFQDFLTMVEEYRNDDYPPKYNLAGMARIIDAEYLLNLAEDKIHNRASCFEVVDPIIESNNKVIGSGSREIMRIDIQALLHLLFDEHHPIMNLMLE